MPQLSIIGKIYDVSIVSAVLNSTGDSPSAQRYANVKLATVLLPVDFTIFFFHSVFCNPLMATPHIYYRVEELITEPVTHGKKNVLHGEKFDSK